MHKGKFKLFSSKRRQTNESNTTVLVFDDLDVLIVSRDFTTTLVIINGKVRTSSNRIKSSLPDSLSKCLRTA